MVLADLHEELAHAPARILGDARAVDEEGCRHHRVCDKHVIVSKLINMFPPLYFLRLHPAAANIMTSRMPQQQKQQQQHAPFDHLACSLQSLLHRAEFLLQRVLRVDCILEAVL